MNKLHITPPNSNFWWNFLVEETSGKKRLVELKNIIIDVQNPWIFDCCNLARQKLFSQPGCWWSTSLTGLVHYMIFSGRWFIRVILKCSHNYNHQSQHQVTELQFWGWEIPTFAYTKRHEGSASSPIFFVVENKREHKFYRLCWHCVAIFMICKDKIW